MYSALKTGQAVEVFASPLRNWSLSPNGKLIALIGLGDARNLAQLRSTETGEVRDLIIQGHAALGNVDWSADGKSLLITATDSTGAMSLLNVTLDGRVTVLLDHTSSSIIAAIPALDGRSLAIDEFHAGPTTVWSASRF
jgi:hypothetical protein